LVEESLLVVSSSFIFSFRFYQKKNSTFLSVEVWVECGRLTPHRGDSLIGKGFSNQLCSDSIGGTLILAVGYPLFLRGGF
jgi:hypothetical protein